MDLVHNMVFWINEGTSAGLYRVVLGDAPDLAVIALKIAQTPETLAKRSSSDALVASSGSPLKSAPNGLITSGLCRPILFPAKQLSHLRAADQIQTVELVQEGLYYTNPFLNPPPPPHTIEGQRFDRDKALYELRCKCMSPFLDVDLLRDSLLHSGGFGPLIAAATRGGRYFRLGRAEGTEAPPLLEPPQETGISRALAYRLLGLLALRGFSESSLLPRYDRCGAKGVVRPVSEGGRKKAGRKTDAERQQVAAGTPPAAPVQLGMSLEWRARILAADDKIPSPKPRWKRRYKIILEKSFVCGYKVEGSLLIPQFPPLGQYPNKEQTRRVIEVEHPELLKLLNSTTKGHFARNMRGIMGSSWEGVSGPGHTWAIDSTVADIYLRSSINRAWVIGRPVVYIVMDVWSTAVMGFFACLEGPSWDMAKIALFCATADPKLISALWGYTYIPVLNPQPTLAAVLLSDRGEYLSVGARQTGMILRVQESFNPAYRPDLKGIGEVPHRIAKDEQFRFIPGAIDARRVELELRKFNPRESVLTMREYVSVLYLIFAEYNLTADRRHRLDATMRATDVVPSPAGLWHWGHSMGIGYRRHVDPCTLISELLPRGNVSITPKGVKYARSAYLPPEQERNDWSALARNFGSSKSQAFFFPGSTSRIWMPNSAGRGVLELDLDEHSQASSDLTFDELADSYGYERAKRAERAHLNNQIGLTTYANAAQLIEAAKKQTAAADLTSTGLKPSITDARRLDVQSQTGSPLKASQTSNTPSLPAADSELDYLARLDAELNSEPSPESAHA